jgi:hypothetical protein
MQNFLDRVTSLLVSLSTTMPDLVSLLPITLRFALLCSLALMVSPSPLDACSGDHYWDSDPEGTLTWYKRGPEIPVRLSLPRALDVVRHALQDAGLPQCDASEKDLVGQKVKIIRAFRTDAVNTRIPAGFIAHQDYSQVMVRIISRGGDEYAAQILTRSKWGHGREQPSEVADQYQDCAATTIAEKVRSNLTPLMSSR